MWPIVKNKYGIEIEKFKEQGDRQYLILANHQTGFDQFFVGYMFKGPIYYIASEDIFSMGFVSTLLKWAVNPIPIKKQATDISAVLNCLRVAKEGATIALFPEGNRTYSGHTEYINPAIAMLAKKLGLPIVFIKIEGGYGIAPRWADKTRKGKMRSYVSRVVEPEEYKSLSDSEMMELINRELYVDEAKADGEYTGNGLAEYLERSIYYCPKCNSLSTLESHGDEIECKKCGMNVRYLSSKELEGINYDLPYRFVSDWYEDQLKFINSLDLRELYHAPVYVESGDLFEVIVYKNKKLMLEKASIELFGDRFEVKRGFNEFTFKFDDIRAITVCGKNKLNFYTHDKAYQFTGNERFNALKYVNFVFRYRNIKKAEKGEQYDEFLGL
jgi:1-acyl-sn-glycerol-3-phosphate acyltransferase